MILKKTKKLKILGISHYSIADNRGGGEMMFHEILLSLKESGFDVEAVATLNKGVPIAIDGIKIYRGEEYRNTNLSKYDLVVTQFEEAYKNIDNIKKYKKPVVYVVHNNVADTKIFVKKYKPELVIYNTDWIKKDFGEDGIVIHPPIDIKKYITKPGNMITLVNLTPAKGSNMFYNMAFRLPQFSFLGVEGGYFKNQQQFIKRNNITFQVNTDNMKDNVFSRTKVLLMPSSYESYGMVGVEAMASGIPVVACVTPGLKESLSYAGIFPKDNSIKTWKREISRLMLDKKYYEEKSELCKKRAEEIYKSREEEIKVMVKKVKELI